MCACMRGVTFLATEYRMVTKCTFYYSGSFAFFFLPQAVTSQFNMSSEDQYYLYENNGHSGYQPQIAGFTQVQTVSVDGLVTDSF